MTRTRRDPGPTGPPPTNNNVDVDNVLPWFGSCHDPPVSPWSSTVLLLHTSRLRGGREGRGLRVTDRLEWRMNSPFGKGKSPSGDLGRRREKTLLDVT